MIKKEFISLKNRQANLVGFIPLEVQRRLNINLRTRAKSPIGSILSTTKRSGKPLTGFTIIEVILAIFILTVAVFSSFALIHQILTGASLNQSKLIAYYLAQEGVEIVRNIRDTNWLQGKSWTEGLAVGGGEQEADYLSMFLTVSQDRYLKIDPNGFYNYTSGTETKFKRKINVTGIENGYLEVKVIIEWSERGKKHEVEVITHLYNWLSGPIE